jgi:phosphoserine phosphatase
VQLETSDAVWSRIEALVRAEPGGVVATDGDGTLWRGDVGEDLFHAFVGAGRVEPPAAEALRHDARAHGISDAGTGADVAQRIYTAYVDGLFPEERVCEVMTWCFAGWPAGELRTFARDVVDRAGLGERLHPEVLHVLDKVRAAGVRTLLVSASPIAVVVEAAARVGFEADRVIAARPCYRDDVVVADVERPIPYGAGKVTRLREHLAPGQLLYAAFGDNAFDVAMLAASRVPVAVRPKPRLRERASAVPGLVELAK